MVLTMIFLMCAVLVARRFICGDGARGPFVLLLSVPLSIAIVAGWTREEFWAQPPEFQIAMGGALWALAIAISWLLVLGTGSRMTRM